MASRDLLLVSPSYTKTKKNKLLKICTIFHTPSIIQGKSLQNNKLNMVLLQANLDNEATIVVAYVIAHNSKTFYIVSEIAFANRNLELWSK